MKPAMAIEVTAVDHIVLKVRDLDRSLSFYRDWLGLEAEFLEDYTAGRRPFVSLRAGAQLIDLVPDPGFAGGAEDPKAGLLHFCLRIRRCPLEKLFGAFEAAGVEVLGGGPRARMGATGMGMSIYVRDPDGYLIEIKEER